MLPHQCSAVALSGPAHPDPGGMPKLMAAEMNRGGQWQVEKRETGKERNYRMAQTGINSPLLAKTLPWEDGK